MPPNTSRRTRRIEAHLQRLYGASRGATVARDLRARLARRSPRRELSPPRPRLTERDTVLITYGDALQVPGEAPLATLRAFAARRLAKAFSTIHLLPFFPYSSDDGFSVMDFAAVDPALGTWDDIAALRDEGFSLIFDLVLNHVSSRSAWFQAYLAGDPAFADLAIAVDPSTDLSAVTRPRTSPLLTPYTRSDGTTAHVWTTFSPDQIDLNYANPGVLLRMIDVLLDDVDHGATILRLDAVGFLWKRLGTSCMHLDETHEVIRLLRTILDEVAPEVLLLTETNVPHEENISYLGDDEAQLIYNFSLPPLLLHALTRGDGRALAAWLATLPPPRPGATFLNFTASHDGIGLRPLEGLLPPEAIDALASLTTRRGGQVSMRQRPGRPPTPYELNITYVDALRGADASAGDAHHVARLLASQAITLALPGVPAIYLGTLLGNRNWGEGVLRTKSPRAINREKIDATALERDLDAPGSFRAQVFDGISRLLQIRRDQPAFAPDAHAQLLHLDHRIVAILRRGDGQTLLALTNLSDQTLTFDLPAPLDTHPFDTLIANASGRSSPDRSSPRKPVGLLPYETRWLSTERALPLDTLTDYPMRRASGP